MIVCGVAFVCVWSLRSLWFYSSVESSAVFYTTFSPLVDCFIPSKIMGNNGRSVRFRWWCLLVFVG